MIYKIVLDIVRAFRKGNNFSERWMNSINLLKLRLWVGKDITLKIKNYKLFGKDKQATLILYKEIFLNKEYSFPFDANNIKTILDLGANIGFAAINFSMQYPLANIICFEPNPDSFKLLLHNIEANKLSDRIHAYDYALSDKEGELDFFIGRESTSLASSIYSDKNAGNKIVVKSKRISDFISKYEFVDLVKVDVEGAETLIFNDLFNTGTLRKVKYYIVEFHINIPNLNNSLSTFLHQMDISGYAYSIRSGFERLNGMQDLLIICSRRD